MRISTLAELGPREEVAIIINVNTRHLATLALLSALKHAHTTTLLIDCESTDGSLDWFWRACEEESLPIGLLAGGHIAEFGRIAERHPGLKMHIDHLGRTGGGAGGTDDTAFADLPQMLALARLPNVAVKLSGAPSYSSAPYPYRNIHPYIRQIFDAFGPQRSFWGTDITRMPCSYRQCVTMFTEEMPWLAGNDCDLVMGRAVCEWLGWNPPGLARS